MTKLLSIVVPVYKVEQYINKCLDSCIIYKEDGMLDEVKMEQLEVIIVNDGTPDNSAELSREYTIRYPQTFRQIDKENGGHGSAWNVGLKEATGKYLRFLDSDDWLTNLDKLMSKLAETDADLVFTQMQKVYANASPSCSHITEKSDIVKSMVSFSPVNFESNWSVGNFHNTTYRTANLRRAFPLFLEHVSYDDSILFEASILLSKSYVFFDLVVYNYLLGRIEQSMNIDIQKNKIGDKIKTFEHQIKFVETHPSNDIRINKLVLEIVTKEYLETFALILLLPYSKSHKAMKSLNATLSNIILETIPTKQYKRFLKYPYFIFWSIEKIRSIKNFNLG